MFRLLRMVAMVGPMMALILMVSTTAWPSSKPATRIEPSPVAALNLKQLDGRSDSQINAVSQQRLRMRQVLLLWLLASQPSK